MSRDERTDEEVLGPLMRALRETTSELDAEQVADTRRAVLRVRARRHASVRWVAAAAAVAIFGAGSVVGAMVNEAVRRAPEAAPRAAAVEHAQPQRRARGAPEPLVVAGPEPAPPEAPVAIPSPAPADAVVASAPRERSTGRAPRGRADREEPLAATDPHALEERPAIDAPPDPDEAERSAYDHAHRLHFQMQSWSPAAGAWRSYLEAYPSGRFVPEARFNLAIALLRAGRQAEARGVLEVVARGSYRRDEARALLDAMTRSEAP